MSKLDDELKQALEASEATATAADIAKEPESEDGPRKGMGLLLALLVMGGGILALVFFGVDVSYSKTVGEVVGQEVGERKLRVQGILVHGSLAKRDEPCEFRFKMRPKDDPEGDQLEVRYAQCVVPDTFRDVKGMDVEVTAEGQMVASSGHLEASQIFAKCPSKYEMKQRQAAGEQAPHGDKPAVSPMDQVPSLSSGS